MQAKAGSPWVMTLIGTGIYAAKWSKTSHYSAA